MKNFPRHLQTINKKSLPKYSSKNPFKALPKINLLFESIDNRLSTGRLRKHQNNTLFVVSMSWIIAARKLFPDYNSSALVPFAEMRKERFCNSETFFFSLFLQIQHKFFCNFNINSQFFPTF